MDVAKELKLYNELTPKQVRSVRRDLNTCLSKRGVAYPKTADKLIQDTQSLTRASGFGR